ncbi:MAG: protein translocase subunit SecD [Candidatus Pacebacteria bacterium]|jgi:protein-export membrane protein SecD|nr:protein translocase subunit SecD [Candidatus Paceibacterota bacterium]
MKKKILYSLLFIFALALASAVFCFPQFFNKGIDWANSQTKWGIPHIPEKQFNLGLDVKGGVRLEYQADLSKVPEADRASMMEGVRDLIERRIVNKSQGVTEAQVQISGENRLIVELPGLENIDEAIREIGQTPWLQFDESRSAEETQKIIDKAKELEGKTMEELVKVPDYQLGLQNPYFKETELTGQYLSKANFTFDQNSGKPIVQLKFNDEGAKIFADVTGRNVGKPIAILLDGLSIIDTSGDGKIDMADMYAPNVEEKISGGSAVISGSSLTVKDARTIAQRLNEGALPVPLGQPITQQKIGPTLGAVSFEQTVMAGIWGFLMVVIFMVVYYRLPGLLASIALALYAVVLLAIFKLMGVTMSLAGIGGFILSVGMAVDANVLIFSRLKEELGAGKSLAAAIEEGFKRAWPAIRDGNFTTIVVAFILFFLGTSFVKGFAATLIWGILLSMYSAIIVTRAFLRLAESTRLGKIAWLWKPLA